MARIVLEIVSFPAGGGVRQEPRVFERGSVSVGRGYGNDLIVPDPFVSASHALVRLTEREEIVVEDLGSPNGIYLTDENQKARQKITGSAVLASGGMFVVGHTVIRVFHPAHPVGPCLRLAPGKKTSARLLRPKDTWPALAGFLILYFIQLASFSPLVEVPYSRFVFFELLILLGMAIWSGAWALVGRMIRHRGRFRFHFTLACLYAVAMIPVANAGGFLGYVFAQPVIELLFLLFAGGVAFASLLLGHLTYATSMRIRTRLVAAAAVPLMFGILMSIGEFSFHRQFTPGPPYYERLKPPLLRPVKVKEIDAFVLGTKKTFGNARRNSAE